MLEEDELVEPTPNGAIPADDVAAQVDDINEGVDHLVSRLEELKEIF
jgi:predicted transcriptional regulator